MHLLAGIALGPADPRLPRRPRGRRRADGLRVPAARHEPRRPPRLPHRHQRDLRVVHDHGHHLVDLRQRRHARRGAALGGRRGRVRQPGGTPRTGLDAGRPREGPRARHQRRSRRPRRSRSATRRPSTDLEEELADDARRAGRSSPRPTRPSARPRPPSTSTSSATPLEALGPRGRRRLRHRVLVRDRRQGRPPATTRAGSTASRTSSRPRSSQPTHPTRYAIIQVQPVDRAGDRARARRRPPRRPTPTSRWSR